MRPKDLPGDAPPSALDELLETEDRIAATLADAVEAAGALVAAATADAATREREVEARLVADLAALDQRAQAAREELIRAIEAEAAQTANRYRSLSDTEVVRLAEFVAAEVTGLVAEAGS
jgi:hypothetical protein